MGDLGMAGAVALCGVVALCVLADAAPIQSSYDPAYARLESADVAAQGAVHDTQAVEHNLKNFLRASKVRGNKLLAAMDEVDQKNERHHVKQDVKTARDAALNAEISEHGTGASAIGVKDAANQIVAGSSKAAQELPKLKEVQRMLANSFKRHRHDAKILHTDSQADWVQRDVGRMKK